MKRMPAILLAWMAAGLLLSSNTALAQSRRTAFIDLVRIHACGYLVNALTGGGLWHGGLYEQEYVVRVVEANVVTYRNNKSLTCGRIVYPEHMSDADQRAFEEKFETPAFDTVSALLTTPEEGRGALLQEHVEVALKNFDHSHEIPKLSVDLTHETASATVWTKVPAAVEKIDAWLVAQRGP